MCLQSFVPQSMRHEILDYVAQINAEGTNLSERKIDVQHQLKYLRTYIL